MERFPRATGSRAVKLARQSTWHPIYQHENSEPESTNGERCAAQDGGQDKLKELHGAAVPMDETVISPQSVFASDLLETVLVVE